MLPKGVHFQQMLPCMGALLQQTLVWVIMRGFEQTTYIGIKLEDLLTADICTANAFSPISATEAWKSFRGVTGILVGSLTSPLNYTIGQLLTACVTHAIFLLFLKYGFNCLPRDIQWFGIFMFLSLDLDFSVTLLQSCLEGSFVFVV